ncbi:hypothetical protein [Salsuginibacillus kocurii]|uniref:hypothetical protein n=1 Tax=Salsuginibacillus kocurii TaxID=427078 RepID=UPI00037CCC32|nr:hypothetical protein [Salsuginibacillus kocurii]
MIYILLSFVTIGLVVWGIYDSKKKNEVKLEQIKLEREKIALAQKRLERENK